MASSSGQRFYSADEVLAVLRGDLDIGEDSLGMNEEEEDELDSQLGLYSDKSR